LRKEGHCEEVEFGGAFWNYSKYILVVGSLVTKL
jgi:hypothetical protein